MFIHRYFSNHFFGGLKIRPTDACTKAMKSYGILSKEINNEYFIFYKDELSRESLLSQLKKPLQLSFYVFCEDVFLLNYSDFSFDDMNQGFMLRNGYSEDSSSQALHKNELLSEEEKIVLISSYNALASYCKSEEETVVLRKRDQSDIFRGKLKDLKISHSFTDIQEIGSFEVLIGDDLKAMNCYAVEPTTPKIFGVIELMIDPGMLNSEGISYKATIGSKQVVWRYHVVNREQVSYKDFKIYAGKNLLSIKKESQIVLGTGENAYLLETSDPITMAERYENLYELEFVKEDLKTGQVLSKKRLGLPVPEISKIKISKNEEGYKAFSDMYIYL